MEKRMQIYEDLLKKTNEGKNIPIINKNGVDVHALTIFEDIILRNLNNLDTVALEINNTKLTYREFFLEVEKYMSALKNLGLKKGDIISLCLPVNVEFPCLYFAATTLGIATNALNIMFLASFGIDAYVEKRCSDVLVCDVEYYKLLSQHGLFNNAKIKTLIISGDAPYTHMVSDSNEIIIPGKNVIKGETITLNDFLKLANDKDELKSVSYDEERLSTLNYTSGTTGKPKCMGHSDLAPLFLIASHDYIKRDEHAKDRTLVTIPLQHPTGLFYAMVFQLAQGKTLVLEPRYDKRLFSYDIITKNINHAVQAKPFYAQLIQDRADGLIRPGDFANFRNPYSGGEGIPYNNLKEINEVLHYAGCPNDLTLGYGRSEEGSLTIAPYNIKGRDNTVGIPLPGIEIRVVDPKTLKDLDRNTKAKGETLLHTPVRPLYNSYLGDYNVPVKSDGSFIENGKRWNLMEDVSTFVELPDKSLSLIVLGRTKDKALKDGKYHYLFDLKEEICNIKGVQECEVVRASGQNEDYIKAHIVIKNSDLSRKDEIMKEILSLSSLIDVVKDEKIFGINATSGKCDREGMSKDLEGYYSLENNELIDTYFEKEEDHVLMRTRRK